MNLFEHDSEIHEGDAQKSLVNDFKLFLSDFLDNSTGTMGIPSSFKEFVERVHKRILIRDSYSHRRWPVAYSTSLGTWFAELPIEVLPNIPKDALSKETMKQVMDHSSRWSHDENIDNEAIFNDLFSSLQFDLLCESDRRHLLWLGFVLLLTNPDPWSRDRFYNQPWPLHPDPKVRSLVLSMAFIDLPWVPAEKYLYSCTHDTDEPVFIKAFRICGRRYDERAMDHLTVLVSSIASVIQGLHNGKMFYPVGHGAGNVIAAMTNIIGTDDPVLAQQREKELMKTLRQPLHEVFEHARPKLESALKKSSIPTVSNITPKLTGMVKIPAGEFISGMDEREVINELFDWKNCIPRRQLFLPTYYIDRYPVTNEQYDAWFQNIQGITDKSWFEHPGQHPKKSHLRNTYGDPRYGPNHPVTGIDWFDAWAYAHFHGKELPSELQWEKAARGEKGLRFPWGNYFNPDALQYADKVYEKPVSDLIHWCALLSRSSLHFPQNTTAPVDGHPEGLSPYGVWDMCGNIWEYTRTSFTGKDIQAPFRFLTPVELYVTRESFVVIKGGAWSSMSGLIGTAYKGYDVLTDRHVEIGFRCMAQKRGKTE